MQKLLRFLQSGMKGAWRQMATISFTWFPEVELEDHQLCLLPVMEQILVVSEHSKEWEHTKTNH